MARKSERKFSSLKWIHRVREEHYRKTKDLPLEAWLQPVDPETAARSCRKLGLKVRVAPVKKRRMRQRA